MNRVRFDVAHRPTISDAQVIAIGAADASSTVLMTLRVRGSHVDVTADEVITMPTAAIAAPIYTPQQRAHTGTCATPMWNDRSGR
jgi:hypothetical protein